MKKKNIVPLVMNAQRVTKIERPRPQTNILLDENNDIIIADSSTYHLTITIPDPASYPGKIYQINNLDGVISININYNLTTFMKKGESIKLQTAISGKDEITGADKYIWLLERE